MAIIFTERSEWNHIQCFHGLSFQSKYENSLLITQNTNTPLKFNSTSGSKQHNINFHVFFDYTAEKTCFFNMSTDCLVMQEWGIDRKSIDRRFKTNTIFRPE
jgi:hypothetical protein